MTTAFRFTSADLEQFPDIEGVRYEIIDGDLYVSRPSDEAHQYTCTVFASSLHVWSAQTGAGLTVPGPGLVFSEDNDVIPDLVWISHARRALARDEKGHYTIAPELVIEVPSPGSVNERRDRDLKLSLYSRQGAQECWIADWQQRLIEVYRRPDASGRPDESGRDSQGLRLVATLFDGELITSPLFPGFACPVSSLWASPISG